MEGVIGQIAARIFAVLGVAVVVALLWQWYSNDRLGETYTQLQTASTQLWAHYRPQATRYGTAVIPTATVIKLRALPDGAICGTETCNPFGGVWQFTGATNTLQAALDNVNDTDCARLVTSVPPAAGVTMIRIGSTLSAVASASANNTPVPPDTAAAACVNGTNAIQFSVNRTQ